MAGARAGDESAQRAWLRTATRFVLDISEISRAGGDLLEPLLTTAILQANQRAILDDPELQARYGGSKESLPDDLRRPISINALAASLRIPFETVRRRVRSLEARGVCAVSSGGVIVTQAAATSPAYRAIQLARVARLGAFYDELLKAGEVSESQAVRRTLAESPRAADRLLANYMLRVCDSVMQLAGDALNGLVLLALCAENLRRPGEPQPCRVRRLAAVLHMSFETVRRRTLNLAEAGLCSRTRLGWTAAIARDAAAFAPIFGEANLQRLFAQLEEVGVLGEVRSEFVA